MVVLTANVRSCIRVGEEVITRARYSVRRRNLFDLGICDNQYLVLSLTE